jgi:nitroreductase
MEAQGAARTSPPAMVSERTRLRTGALTPGRLAVAICLLGGLLRLYRYDALSLWVDEGNTVFDARLPWSTLLGANGPFEPHPPLYFLLVKLMSAVAPEMVAGRLVSLAAGVATIGALYALGARLAGPRVGLLAALALALAPLHIWYSQEARPYALTALLVCGSYLALLRCAEGAGRGRLVAYAVVSALALYTEYSAVFALAPQAALMAILARRRPRAAGALVLAGGAAGLAFTPWLPQLLQSAGPASRQPQFTLTADKIGQSLLSVISAGGNTSYFWGSAPTAWERGPGWQAIILALAALGLGWGTVALARRSALACATAWGLLLGPPLVALLIGVVYPSYAERTILSATLGWALLIGAAGAGLRSPTRLRGAPGALCLAGALIWSGVTLDAIYRGAIKQQWRDLAAATADVAGFGWPILAYPTLTGTLLDLYQPQTLAGRHTTIADFAGAPAGAGAGAPALWLAYVEAPGIESVRAQLAAQGLERIYHGYFPNPLYLDLYAAPGAPPGQAVRINGAFQGEGGVAPGWRLPAGAALRASDAGGRELTLSGPGEARAGAPAQAGSLYTLGVEARTPGPLAERPATLRCLGPGGAALAEAPADAAGPAAGAAWRTLRLAVLCPAGVARVEIALRAGGATPAGFRRVTLAEARRP